MYKHTANVMLKGRVLLVYVKQAILFNISFQALEI